MRFFKNQHFVNIRYFMNNRNGQIGTYFLTCLLSFLIVTSATAQSNMEEVVHLKNGSEIRGVIIEQVPNQTIKIKTKDGSIFVYSFDEVEKITKEEAPKTIETLEPIAPSKTTIPNSATAVPTSRYNEGKRYVNITEVVIASNITKGSVQDSGISYPDRYGKKSIMVRMVNGGHVNEYLSLGFGIGFDFSTVNDTLDYVLMPLSFDLRTNFLKGPVSPTMGFGIGYSIGLDSTYRGGFHVHPQLGVRVLFTKRFGLVANLGYKWQSMTYIKSQNPYYQGPILYDFASEKIRESLRFSTFSLGFTF